MKPNIEQSIVLGNKRAGEKRTKIKRAGRHVLGYFTENRPSLDELVTLSQAKETAGNIAGSFIEGLQEKLWESEHGIQSNVEYDFFDFKITATCQKTEQPGYGELVLNPWIIVAKNRERTTGFIVRPIQESEELGDNEIRDIEVDVIDPKTGKAYGAKHYNQKEQIELYDTVAQIFSYMRLAELHDDLEVRELLPGESGPILDSADFEKSVLKDIDSLPTTHER